MTVVCVRGGCGSGKSTVVRAILREQWDSMRPRMSVGRRWPVGYENGELFVAGHYERETMGGIDTFRTLDQAYGWVDTAAGTWELDVLYEGKCQSVDVPRVVALDREFGVRVVHLTTTPGECLESVRERATANAIQKIYVLRSHAKAARDAESLVRAGVAVDAVSRYDALDLVRRILG